MKSPSSLSSPSSSSSCHGFIPRILRRILCFTGLPSCPFDLRENDDDDDDNERSPILVGSSSPSSTPGVVARLMGLESIPPINQRILLLTTQKSPKVRIVPSPAYQELEDEHFFILSFEQRINSGKDMNPNFGKKKHRKRREQRQKNNNELIQVRCSTSLLRPIRNSERMREKCDDSENSSPNSVLEFVEFPSDDHEETAACSGNSCSRLANSKLRRTLSEELENCRKSNDVFGQLEKLNTRRNYTGKWSKIGEMATTEMIKSRWFNDEISTSLKEIGRDVASQLLDLLINELIIDAQNPL